MYKKVLIALVVVLILVLGGVIFYHKPTNQPSDVQIQDQNSVNGPDTDFSSETASNSATPSALPE